MMKYFMGVCCAMLLGLSACGDIDSPEFPPSEVKSEVKEAVDFSYTELHGKCMERKYIAALQKCQR
ncbi:hypothetical protein PZH42_30905, partial [Bacteroides cellulosilyticus]|nr:hypothetical protein [Bacteroides cellulosilyticus]